MLDDRKKNGFREKREQIQNYSPLFEIPNAHAGNEVGRYQDAVNGRNKCSELFNGRRENLWKGEHHGDVADDADDGYENRAFQLKLKLII